MSCTTGTADAVHERHRIIGDLVVDYVRDVIDVDTARSHVGSHKNVHGALAESSKGALACRLIHIAMDCAHAETSLC